MKNLFYLLTCMLILYACTKKPNPMPRFYPPFQVKFNTVITLNNKNVNWNYKYAYGIGKEDSLIKVVPHPFLKNNLMDTFYFDSNFFPLPLNSNADTVIFCMVRNDNSIDTIGLSYRRIYYVYHSDGYRFRPQDEKIFYLSSAFLKDSCTLKYERDKFYYYNGTNVRLVLKP